MDIQKYKDQHVDIMRCIQQIRRHAQAGIPDKAQNIIHELTRLRFKVSSHLALENRFLYPKAKQSKHTDLISLADKYKDGMQSLAPDIVAFIDKWKFKKALQSNPEGFRQEANKHLKKLHQRIQHENREFYPILESALD